MFILLRTRGKSFRSLDKFDIDWHAEGSCIIGPNGSGKSTSGHAAIWGLVGRFPDREISKFSNDYVVPGSSSTEEKGKRRTSGSEDVTVVENFFLVPGFSTNGEPSLVHYRSVRAYDHRKKKMIFMIENQDKTVRLYNTKALNQILDFAKIADFGSANDRVKAFLRKVWYGVGQDTSFFSSSPKDRKKIIEAAHPFKKLPRYEIESSQRLKKESEKKEGLQKELLEFRGLLKAKKEELYLKLKEVDLSFTFSEESEPESDFPKLISQIESLINSMLSDDSFSIESKEQKLKEANNNKNRFEQEITFKKRIEEQKALWEKSKLEVSSSMANISKIEAHILAQEETIQKLEKIKGEIEEIFATDVKIKNIQHNINVLDEKIKNSENKLNKTTKEIDAISFADVLVSKIGFDASLRAESIDDINQECVDHLRRFLSKFIKKNVISIIEIDINLIDALLSTLKERHIELNEQLSSLNNERQKIENDENLISQLRFDIEKYFNVIESIATLEKSIKNLLSEKKKNEEDFLKEENHKEKATSLIDSAITLQKLCGNEPKSLFDGKKVERSLFDWAEFIEKNDISSISSWFSGCIDRIEETSKILDEQEKELSFLKKDESSTKEMILSLKLKISSHEEKISNLLKTLEKSDSTSSCDHCGGELNAEHIEKVIKYIKDLVENDKASIDELESKLRTIIENKSSIENNAKTTLANKESIERVLNDGIGYSERLCRDAGVNSEGSIYLSYIEDKLITIVQAMEMAENEVKELNSTKVIKNNEKDLLANIIFKTLGINDEIVNKDHVFKIYQAYEADAKARIRKSKERLEETVNEKKILDQTLSSFEEEMQIFIIGSGFGSEWSLKKIKSLELSEQKEQLESLVLNINKEIITIDQIEKNRKTELTKISQELSIDEDRVNVTTVASLIKEAKQKENEEKKRLNEERDKNQKVYQIEAVINELRSHVSAETMMMSDDLLLSQKISLEQKVKKAESELLAAQKLGDLCSSLEAAKAIFNRYLSIKDLIEESEDKIYGLTVLKGLLTPNGDARTLALSNDVAAVVKKANDFLSNMDLGRQLAIDLKLEKDDEDQSPIIQINFEVDGITGGKILPSESQKKILGLCTDIAIMQLSSSDSFIFVDEPETGLDNVNRPKVTNFLKQISPQTILITNTAADGFSHTISTDQVRHSVSGDLSLSDFDFDFSDVDKEDGEESSEKPARASKGKKRSSVIEMPTDIEDDGEI